MSVRVFAPAKINLTLQSGKLRADGFHPLQSLVMFADVGDWIEVSPASTLNLQVSGPFANELREESDNIVLRAARAVAARMGRAPAVNIRLEKNLPVASGIGGGSSDAAATLKALNQLWTLRLGEAALIELAKSIGADVPVCVVARSAWITGVGERIERVAAAPLWAVLANPRRRLPTAAVFAEFDRLGLGRSLAVRTAPEWRTAEEAVLGATALGNDLAPAARALLPEIADVEVTLSADPRARYVALSGSGATVFAIVDDSESAAAMMCDLSRADWWVRATRLGAT